MRSQENDKKNLERGLYTARKIHGTPSEKRAGIQFPFSEPRYGRRTPQTRELLSGEKLTFNQVGACIPNPANS
jgi:hypothetical protein